MSGSEGAHLAPEERAEHGWHVEIPSILAALQFLTVSPPLVQRPFTPEELGRAVGYFPLVGLLVGLVLVGLESALRLALPAGLAAALLIGAWVILTGALHLDGFLDMCDGLFGGHTPEQRLEIMRDHRIGAFALAGGVLLLLLQYSALQALADRRSALVMAPLLGRWAMSLAIVAYPYARPQGLGRLLKDGAHGPQLILATAVAVAAAGVVGQWRGLVALGLAGLAVWLGARFVLRRIPGLTGDTYGALCVTVETITLIYLVASQGVG